MAVERYPAALVMLVAVVTLLAVGVVEPGQAFVGFSNPAPITVAALYVLARSVELTGALERPTARLFPLTEPGRPRRDLARILLPTAGASAFLNNTPIVAMLAPQITAWARRTGRSASRYLMPLSFAAIVGGLITVIGTSTNLVVSGFLEEAGMEPLGLFEITRVGLPLAIVAIVVLIVIAPLLVPDRRPPHEALAEETPEFTIEMIVEPGSPLVGRSISEARLRDLEGVYLVELERDGRSITAVGPDEVLVDGDRLVFAGDVRRILDLQQMPGLRSAEEHHFEVAGSGPDRRFFEAIVSEGSRLAGSTLKESGFRARYGGAVVAIHRAGQALHEKLGEVPLRRGDVLLVLAHRDFARRWREHHDFIVAAPIDGGAAGRPHKAWLVRAGLLGLLVTAGTGLVDILTASLVVAVLLVGLRVLSISEAREAVDFNVIILIAASFGLGIAMTTSGLAEVLAGGIVGAFGGLGDIALLAGVLVTTMGLTALISNNAAAVLMFPIAIAAGTATGVDPRPLAIAVAVGASCEFLTPIGYQTNTMVYGIGGYRFGDFARLGVPFTLITIVVATALIPLGWPLR